MKFLVGLAAALPAGRLVSRRAATAALGAAVALRGPLPTRAADEITSEIIKAAPADAKSPQRAQRVFVDYTLWVDGFEGKKIDSSKGLIGISGGGFPFRVGVGEVIPGWDRTVKQMKVGEVRRFVVPPSLGYGEAGAGGKIPPNARLYFEVELLEMRDLKPFTEKEQQWLDSHPEP